MALFDLIPSSVTDELSLDEVLARLRAQPEIDGILLAGTTGKTTLKPYSDYDLLIVLNEMAEPPSLIVTGIDGYLAELYFWRAAAIDEILEAPEQVEANSLHGAFVSMTARGEIVHDASGRLTRLREVAPHTFIESIQDHQRYDAWYSLTYNHAQNLRYFKSQDPLYLEALQCRLLYSISNCLSAYFSLRGLPWRGEKEAIRYLRAHDLVYWAQFLTTVSAGGIQRRFPEYVRLIELTLPAGLPLWPESYIVVQPTPGLTADLIARQTGRWRRWVGHEANPE